MLATIAVPSQRFQDILSVADTTLRVPAGASTWRGNYRKILPMMKAGISMRAFLQKGQMSSMLEKVLVRLVLNSHVGLIAAYNALPINR